MRIVKRLSDWVLHCSTHVELLQSRALYHPEKQAYTFLADGEREENSLTFADLDRQARVIAASLQEMQIGGRPVLLLYQPGLEYLAAFFGCLYAGAIAVPAYPPRLNHNLERIEAIVSDAQPVLALSSQTLATPAMRQQFASFSYLGSLHIETTDTLPGSLADRWREPKLDADTLAFLQYSSGSTGRPKGVMVSHRNLLYNHRMLQTALQHSESAPLVSWLPLFHDMGLIGNALQSIYQGVPCIFMSPVAFLQKPFRWLHAISRYKAYSAFAPNFAYDLCVQKITSEQLTQLDLSCWHNAINAAEPIRSDTLERFAETFAPCGFRRETFVPGYGLAEATLVVSTADSGVLSTVRRVDREALEQNKVVATTGEETRIRNVVGCGHTWLEQKILVVDPDTHMPCHAGQVGEIWISGSNVAQGYWKRPEETKEVFQAKLANGAEGLFMRTGDLGFLDDGELFVTGRLKDLIIVYGRNYYPQDIEAVAERSHPALRPNCSAAFSLDIAGEEQVILVQEIERQYRHQQPQDVFAAIREAVLDAYELHVYGIVLIKPGSIPKTSSGKIQHRACREALLAQSLPIVFSDVPQPLDDLIGHAGVEQAAKVTNSQKRLEATRLEPVHGVENRLENMSNTVQKPLVSQEAAMGTEPHNMQFSLLYFASNEMELAENKYELFLEGARFADQHDFTAVWIPERHFHPFGGLYPNPSVLAAALAVATDKIRLRAGSVVLPMHHPARVAEEWSVVDNLSAGRVDIAFATGWNPNDFALAPENYAGRKELLFSGIETFNALWRGDGVPFSNGLGRETTIKTYPRPRQRQLTPWITCTGNPERFVEAGAMGANVLTGLLFQSVEELAEKIQVYRDARARHGHDPSTGHVTLMLHTFVNEDMDEVRSKVRQPFTAYLESSVDLWRHGIDKLDNLTPQEREKVLAYAFERYFQTHSLFGTPQTCEKIVAHLSEIGVDEIAALIDFGMDLDTIMDGLHWLNVLRKRCQKGIMPRRQSVANKAPEEPVVESKAASAIEALPVPTRRSHENGSLTETDHELARQLYTMPQSQRQVVLKRYLQQQIALVLERRVEEITGITAIRGLGLNSLKVMSLVNNCERDLQIELDAGRFYDLTSLEALTQYIAEEYDRVHTNGRHAEPAQGTLPLLQRQKRQMYFPQSFAQQRLWLLSQLQPFTTAYNVATAISIKGKLNAWALLQSMTEIVQRHEILRTTFAIHEEQPVQIISSSSSFSLPVVDLNLLDLRSREREIERLGWQEAQRPFDLVHGPLIRVTLVALEPAEHLLLLTYHHIVADGWSRGVLMRELQEFYTSFAAGRLATLADLPIQYADFAVWQREWLQRPTAAKERLMNGNGGAQKKDEEVQTLLASHLAYWKKQLAGPPPVLALPTDHPRPTLQTFHGAHLPIQLSAQCLQDLKALSEREGTTLFMTLLASFQVLLARYTGQEDISVGSPIANRLRAETEPLIGFFANTLVFRTDLSANPSFQEVLRRVRTVCLEGYAHQEVPFEQVVEAVYPMRDLSRSPLFQVLFGLNEASWYFEADVAGLKLRQVELESGISAFDLTWLVNTEGLGTVEYNTDLFEECTISRLLAHWYRVLQAIVADPGLRLADIPLLIDEERTQQLVDWNNTERIYPQQLCLHQLFEHYAKQQPFAIALKSPVESLTYQEMDRRANQIARALRSLGLAPQERVGVCMGRVPEAFLALLGILKASGTYVPLDPRYPSERLAFMVEDAQISVLLTQEQVRNALPELGLPTLCLDAAWFQESSELTTPLALEMSPQQLAYIIYTSGSTGLPKGVQVSHQGIQNLVEVQREAFELHAEDHVLQFSSLSFDASIWEVCMSLGMGATLCLEAEQIVLAGPALKDALENLEITVVTLPPSILASLPAEGLSQLRTIIVAGEACPPALAQRWSGGRRFFNAYGPTETTVCATMEQCQDGMPEISIGRPIANTRIYLLDAAMQPVPVGVPGELYIGGVSLAYGYFKRPELSAERFVPDPFVKRPGERLYKTGDRARYRADGAIEYLGRIDTQVKLRGYRIEPGEIEAVLLQHPSIRECAVVVQEMASTEKGLVAYVVLRAEAAFSHENLRVYLQQHLPEYMVPTNIVPLERMLLTPSGKIDRRRLPDGRAVRREQEAMLALPSNAAERVIADIWQEYLHVEKIGRDENFFELGGHSLLAVQIFQRLQSHFQGDLVLTDLFKYPTVSALARYLNQMQQQHVSRQESSGRELQEGALEAGKTRLKQIRLRQGKA
jgi:natural product biosynthesis luciferase-like monooxygenase protein/amino acid adenylation domain-containing protein